MANRYWVGGAASWDGTAGTKWATTSGGAGGAAVPTASDDVFFDAASGAVTVTVAASAVCNNLDFTGFTGTFAGSSALAISGNLVLDNSMTRTYTGTITFNAATTGKTITSDGVTLASAIVFNGVGGGWTLQDAFLTTSTITFTRGTLTTNNQALTCSNFLSNSSSSRTLNFGSSTITITSDINSVGFSFTNSNGTLNAGTSNIVFTGGSTVVDFTNGRTFYNMTFQACQANAIRNSGTFNNITVTGAGVTTGEEFAVWGNLTVNGTFSVTGNSAAKRVSVESITPGTNVTITAAATSFTNVDFRNITAAGAATWTGTTIGNCGGNSNISSFTAAVTRYWVGNAGSASSTSKWSASSGGASGASVPLPQDTIVFDANSITTSPIEITYDLQRSPGIDLSNVLNSPIFTHNNLKNEVYGSYILDSTISYSNSNHIELFAVDNASIDLAGKSFGANLTIYAAGKTVTLLSHLVLADVANGAFTHSSGTFDANDFNVTCYRFTGSSSSVSTVNMGSGTWTLTGDNTDVWNASNSNLTLNAETSTILISDTGTNPKNFYGGGKTYNILEINAPAVFIYESSTFDTIGADLGRTISFEQGMTTTVRELDVAGVSGNLTTLKSSLNGTAWFINRVSENLITNFVALQDSHGIGNEVDASYSAAAGTYNWRTLTGAATTLTLGDDELSTGVVIPFNFQFYEAVTTTWYIDSNGAMYAQTAQGSVSGHGESLPSYKGIYGIQHDLDPSAGGTVKYETFGTTPNRVFVVEYNGVPTFPAGTPDTDLNTFQIQLFEADNRIEIHTDIAPTGENDGDFSHDFITQGVSDGADEYTVLAENRNRSQTPFNLDNDAAVFTPIASSPNTVKYYAGGDSTNTSNNENWLFVGAIAPNGLSSSEAFGTASVLNFDQFVTPSAIASAEAFGTASVSRRFQFLQVSSFRGDAGSNVDVFGTPNVGIDVIIYPQPLHSEEAFGTPNFKWNQNVVPSAIVTAEAFGTARIGSEIAPSGIATAEAFGTARLRHLRAPVNLWRRSAQATTVWTPSDSN